MSFTASTELTPIMIVRIMRELGKFPEVVAALRADSQLLHILHDNTDLKMKMINSPDARTALSRLRAMAAALRIVPAPLAAPPLPTVSPLNLNVVGSDPILVTRSSYASMIASTDVKNPPAFTEVAAQAIDNPRAVFLYGETADKVQDAVQTVSSYAPTLVREIVRAHGKFPAPDAQWVLELQHEFFRQAARDIVRPVCAGAVDSFRRQQAISSGTEKPHDITSDALDALLEKNKDIGATFLLVVDMNALKSTGRKSATTHRPK